MVVGCLHNDDTYDNIFLLIESNVQYMCIYSKYKKNRLLVIFTWEQVNKHE